MSGKKIVVPEEMLDAVNGASVVAQNLHDESLFEMLEAALRWLSDNPIVPTVEQSSDMMEKFPVNTTRNVCVEWQRRMFLASKPDFPEEMHNLLWSERETGNPPSATSVSVHARQVHNRQIVEAYRLGQQSKGNS